MKTPKASAYHVAISMGMSEAAAQDYARVQNFQDKGAAAVTALNAFRKMPNPSTQKLLLDSIQELCLAAAPDGVAVHKTPAVDPAPKTRR